MTHFFNSLRVVAVAVGVVVVVVVVVVGLCAGVGIVVSFFIDDRLFRSRLPAASLSIASDRWPVFQLWTRYRSNE